MTSRALTPRSVLKRVAGIIAAGIALAGVLLASASPGGASTRATAASLQRELAGLVRSPSGPPGAIAIVQRGSRQTVYSAGVAQFDTGIAVSANDRMRIASTSKAFSGAVALELVARHRLKLNATIAQLLPALPASWGPITLRQLLDHTSGLEDFSQNDEFLRYLTNHLHATPSPAFILRFIAAKALLFTPGSEYHYSNTDNFIVALMAEAATHRPYRQLLRTYVERPLALRATSLPGGFAMPAPYLHGYEVDAPQPPTDVSTLLSAAYAWASGGIVSTPADLNTFIRAYAGGRLFSGATRAAQLRFVPGDSEPIGPGDNSVGLGIFRYRTPCGTVYGHTGNTSGYTQFMAATLDGRRSVTVSISEQATNKSKSEALRTVFARLRAIESDAVCLALR